MLRGACELLKLTFVYGCILWTSARLYVLYDLRVRWGRLVYKQWATVLEEWERWSTRIRNELDWSDVATDPHI